MNTDKSSRFPFRLLLLPLLVLALRTPAAVLFYEGFDYRKGEELGDSLATSQRWENDKSQFTVGSGSLDYAGLQPSTGNRLNIAATTPSLDSVRTTAGLWPAQEAGALYVSFLLRVESADEIAAAGEGSSVLTLGKASNGSFLLGINLLNRGGLRLGAVKYASRSTPSSASFFSSGPGANLATNGSTVLLMVAKYEWVDGADNDVVTLWVNPAGLGDREDPDHKVFTSAGSDGNQPAGRLTLSRGPNLIIDEIRVGQTWADVTPTGGSRPIASDR